MGIEPAPDQPLGAGKMKVFVHLRLRFPPGLRELASRKCSAAASGVFRKRTRLFEQRTLLGLRSAP
jgi:hypothetical protein